MLAAHAVTKRFGARVALCDLTLQIRPGEIVGLLGPNGAGKSTTLRLCSGALAPDSGRIVIDGRWSPREPEARRRLGIAPQELALYGDLTVLENLRFFARLYDLSGARLAQRIDFALELAALGDRRDDRARHLSGGMARRLNLACAVVHDPELVLLDEPTVGVDPQSREHLLGALERLARSGLTAIYSTHYMEEAERLCHRVVVLDQGRVLADGGVRQLIAQHGGSALVRATIADADGEREVSLRTDDPAQAVARLGVGGASLRELHVERPNLEHVFLALTGRSLRD